MMKRIFCIGCLLVCSCLVLMQLHAQDIKRSEAIQNWKNYRVGLFVHWGPSAGLGTPESHSHARQSALNPNGSISAEQYDQLYTTFNPVNYDPKVWIDLAYDAGMRYAVFVAKHHDGFNMFDTKATDYQIMSTPYKKDVAKMFADAVHEKKMGLGWQFSPKDWKHPDYNTPNHDRYNAYYLQLLNELTTQYGKVDVMWFDGIEPAGSDKWKDAPAKATSMMYANQPLLMLGTHGAVKEDFVSHELGVGPFERSKPWETAEPINPSGWIFNKPMPSFPFRDLLRNLVYTISRDGNYLLDIGPMPDGRLYGPDEERLKEFAAFMTTNAEGVHGTRGGPYRDGIWGGATCKGKNIYLFVSDEAGSRVTLPAVAAKVLRAKRLDNGPLKWSITGQNLVLEMSDRSQGQLPIFTCIKLELDAEAFELPIAEGQRNLAAGASITVGNRNDPQTKNLFDQDGETAWESNLQDTLCTLDFDFGVKEKITAFSMAEKGQITKWSHWLDTRLYCFDDRKGSWELAKHHNGMLGTPPVIGFPEVETSKVRIEFRKKPTYVIQVSELRLFGHSND